MVVAGQLMMMGAEGIAMVMGHIETMMLRVRAVVRNRCIWAQLVLLLLLLVLIECR